MNRQTSMTQKEWGPFFLSLIFSSITLAKMMLLHAMMGIQTGLLLITVANFSTLLVVYLVVFYFLPNRWLRGFLVTHFLLSTLIFINTVYYSHFFTLIPVSSVFQIGQLGGVRASILSLIRPVYLLYYIDSLVLWHRYRSLKFSIDRSSLRKNPVYLGMLLTLVLSVIFTFTYTTVKTEGHLTPMNLGMLNYHMADLVGQFKPLLVDPDIAEEAVAAIVEEDPEGRWKGLLEGRNIIVIQAESLQSFVMEKSIGGKDITPTINRLRHQDSIYFDRFYEQVGWGNTSDAEFIVHNSFYPSTKTFSYKAYENNTFRTLPMLLKETGYSTMVFHGNDPEFWSRDSAYPGQGIDQFYSSHDFIMEDILGMGLSDQELFHQSLEWMKQSPIPFYSLLITLTSHHPFDLPDELKVLEMPEEYKNTILGDYIHTAHYLDNAIEDFIEGLKKAGLYDQSAIIIFGDHQGLDMRNEEANQQVSLFLNRPYEEDEMFRVPLIIHVPGAGISETVSVAGGQLDVFPTIANLVGRPLEPDKVMGKDLLNTREGFVAKRVHVAAGSFIDNEKIFIMSPDGIFENSRSWLLDTGEEVPMEQCRAGYERALAEVALSEYILQNDLVIHLNEVGLQGILDQIRLMLNVDDEDES